MGFSTNVREVEQPKENGWVEPYPHSDLEQPCTCPECCPDFEQGYWPTCRVCRCRLRQCGICVDCVDKPEAQKFVY